MTPFQGSHAHQGAIAKKMTGRPRGGRIASMTVLAIAMIGIETSGADRAVSVAPDRAETRTPLVVLLAGKDGRAGPVVALGRPIGGRNKEDTLGTSQAILERELIRQAILIAARDELGLPTRDEILDDAPPDQGAGAGEPVEIAILFRPGECHALIRRGQGNQAAILQKHDLGTNPDGGNHTSTVTAKAEALSRIDFPALLKQLGAGGKPNRLRDDAPVPPDVEERLKTLSMVETFAAVRALHAAIRADGESSARLSALARAYAQLGILTEFHWSPAHRAFKARALLYAERLIARDAQSGFVRALQTRAFVRALVGRHDLALADLDEANKRDETARAVGPAPSPSPSPSWLPVIDAYLKADRKRLEAQGGADARLASLLGMMVVEYPPRTRLLIQSARDVIKADADCYRAYDAICENGDLGDLHAATEMGPLAFAKLFPAKLKSLPTLPESVKKPSDQDGDELTLVAQLAQAGMPGQDMGEPSWGVLAHLARETRFVHSFRRLFFMARKWNVPVDEYFEQVRPLVAGHRYFPYLQSFVLSPQQAGRVMSAFADRLDLTDIEPTARHMIDAFRDLKLSAGEMGWRLSLTHCSILAHDVAERLRQVGDRKDHFGRLLLIISPYSGYAMGTLVAADWDRVKGEVPAWREKVGDAPGLIGALGKKYAALKQYDEAEKYLKRYTELSGDEWAYQELSACYEARGDHERARATLDEYLNKTEDAGLQHAQIQVQMANKLMKQGRWQEAKPYADAAAATWAAFGMACASECAEGLKDWEGAELWLRRLSERYPTRGWARWYIFCKRTGHGDLASARALAEAHLVEIAGRETREQAGPIGYFYWSIGSTRKAMEYLEKAESSALNGIAQVLLADELGDKARRDRMLDAVTAQFQGKVPRMVTICKMIRESTARGGEAPLDLAAVDKVLDRMPAKNRGNADFLVGRYLINRRRPEDARKYLRRCADSTETMLWPRLIATDALRSQDSGKE